MNNILIVDDNEGSRQIAKFALSTRQRRISESSGGAEAVCSLLDQPSNLMILDWLMPDLIGADVLILFDNIRGQIANLEVEPAKINVILYSSLDLKEICMPVTKSFKILSYVNKDWPIDVQIKKLRAIAREVL